MLCGMGEEGGHPGDGASAPHRTDQAGAHLPPRVRGHRGGAHGATRAEEALP